jgi:hypothetical protein
LFTKCLTLRIQQKEGNNLSTMASNCKINTIPKHTVITEVDSALGYYRLK